MSDTPNPLGTVQPETPAKESFSQKAKIFFEHVWSFFDHDAKAFATSAATTISLVSPLLNSLIVATAGDKAAAKVSAVVSAVQTKLANVAALLTGAEAGDATHSVAGFLGEIKVDLGALLADADIKNSAKVAQITGVVNTVLDEVGAIAEAIPEDHPAPTVVGTGRLS